VLTNKEVKKTNKERIVQNVSKSSRSLAGCTPNPHLWRFAMKHVSPLHCRLDLVCLSLPVASLPTSKAEPESQFGTGCVRLSCSGLTVLNCTFVAGTTGTTEDKAFIRRYNRDGSPPGTLVGVTGEGAMHVGGSEPIRRETPIRLLRQGGHPSPQKRQASFMQPADSEGGHTLP